MTAEYGHLQRLQSLSVFHNVSRILTRPYKIDLIQSMAMLKTLILAAALAAIFSGCASGGNSQQSNGTTVSGYISAGAEKNLNK
jgi:hypothetical protein